MTKKVKRADQPKVRQRKHIAFRMNLLFFSIFILFSVLILRLGYLQIVKNEDYVLALERKEEISVNTSVPRGRMFDRDGRILVDNEPKNAITYTKLSSTTTQEMLDIAEELALLIDQNTNRTTIGDRRDFWILNNPEAAANKISKKELEKINKDNEDSKAAQREINRLTRERITKEELDSLTDHELEVLAIYREMMSGYAFSPQIIKSEDVTPEEFAIVSERLSDLPGVNTTTDWDRVRKSSNTVLGTTTNPVEGIPRSSLDYYLARDYSRNDRVGRSFLERHYEELLQGQKTVVKNVKDRTGKVVETKTIREGEPGKDLVLTIDSELTEALEEIVSDKLLELKTLPNTQALDKAFLVMMDPRNGEVLSLVGKQVVRNKDSGKYEVLDYAYGTFTAGYRVGSTVKMATLLTGYQEGGARLGETKMDEMIQIGTGRGQSSLFNPTYNRIPVDDVMAIGRSSNVYMYKIAIEMGGGTYRRGRSLALQADTFDRMRNSFESFGLGTYTGIDLPGEQIGFTTEPRKSEATGNILHYSIGQYATYTPLQLAQYVSTIANGGYRIAPKVLKEIREPSPDGEVFGSLIQETESKVLNRIKNTDEEIARIKQGMHYTYYGRHGTAANLFNDADYVAAGKTGTAQDYETVNGTRYETISLSHVGYAPSENPEIAYAVVIPHVWIASSKSARPPVQNQIVRAAVDKYFELKEKKEKELESSDAGLKIKQPLEKEKADEDEEDEE